MFSKVILMAFLACLVLFCALFLWLFLCFLQENTTQTKFRKFLFVFSKSLLVCSVIIIGLFVCNEKINSKNKKYASRNKIIFEKSQIDNPASSNVKNRVVKIETRAPEAVDKITSTTKIKNKQKAKKMSKKVNSKKSKKNNKQNKKVKKNR